MNFNTLVRVIADVHNRSKSYAARKINVALTWRNWLIGAYIFEFEQSGEDRAAYGERLVQKLAGQLQTKNVPRSDERELRRYRQFYLTYPRIRDSLSPEFEDMPRLKEKWDSASPESGLPVAKA